MNQLTESEGVALAKLAFSRAGFFFRAQPELDFGIDAHAEVLDSNEPTGQLLALQIKAGDSYLREQSDAAIVFRGDNKHLDYWINHSLPVAVLLCDLGAGVVYWQLVSEETVERTGAGWKMLIPKNHRVDAAAREPLSSLATNVVPSDRYTILSTQDTSHALAKRYSLEVLINGRSTRAEIASIARQVTRAQIGSDYYRDEIVESHFGKAEANVVSTSIYLSLDDRRLHNWVARSQWIDPKLPQSAAPSRIEGENIGSGITFDWSERHSDLAALSTSHSLSKSEYLRMCKEVIAALEPAVERAAEILDLGGREQEDSLPKDLVDEIDGLYSKASSTGLPPAECAEVDKKLQTVIALAHNIVLPYLSYVPQSGDRSWRSMQQSAYQDFKTELEHLRYELSKVR